VARFAVSLRYEISKPVRRPAEVECGQNEDGASGREDRCDRVGGHVVETLTLMSVALPQAPMSRYTVRISGIGVVEGDRGIGRRPSVPLTLVSVRKRWQISIVGEFSARPLSNRTIAQPHFIQTQ
jgi:hypothetical protein